MRSNYLLSKVLFVLGAAIFVSNASAAVLSGTIFGGSHPLPEVTVELVDRSTGDVFASNDTSSDGLFLLEATSGFYNLKILPPASSGFEVSFVNNIEIKDSDITQNVFLIENTNTALPVMLSGIVEMPDGSPVEGLYVRAGGSYTQTDEFGEYTLSVLPGTHSLSVSTDYETKITYGGELRYADYDEYRVTEIPEVEVTKDQILDTIVLPYVVVSGKTTDSNGSPIGNISISLTKHVGENEYSSYNSINTQSDENGDYLIAVPEGAYDVSVKPGAHSGFSRTTVNNLSYSGNTLQTVILNYVDSVAPIIVSGPLASSIKDSTALISWETDEPATSEVYVTGVLYSVPGLTTSHSVPLSDLLPNTIYEVQVTSTDRASNGPTLSSPISLQTNETPDLAPPVIISEPIVTSISKNSAWVEWTTNEPATSEIEYNANDEISSAELEGLRTHHRIELRDLQLLTQYEVSVGGKDANGNSMQEASQLVFRTLAAPDVQAPLIVSGPILSNITDTEASVVWTTDEPSTSGLSLKNGERYTVFNNDQLTTIS